MKLNSFPQVSGSTDTTLKVWDLSIQPEWSSIGCKATMTGHSDTVRCVRMRSSLDKVISGSYDATIKAWSLSDGRLLATLRGHEGRVICLSWDDDDDGEEETLLSGSTDQSIKVIRPTHQTQGET